MMYIWVFIAIITTLHCTSAAPGVSLQPFELAMLNKLHKPWFTRDKPHQYPSKGEYPCKRGVCKTKWQRCKDCQQAKPLY